MSKYKFEGDIIGNNHHFGDIHISNSDDFINNSTEKYTDTEKDLINIIFENTSTEEERKILLTNLKKVNNEQETTSKIKRLFISFAKKLSDKGLTILAAKVASYIGENFDNLEKFFRQSS